MLDTQVPVVDHYLLVHAVEQFLYQEADWLDQWQLHRWLSLFAPSGRYLVPTTDKPEGDPAQVLFLVHDDRFLLEQRVNSLLTRSAHAEYPHSRTRRFITNVRVDVRVDGRIDVAANFMVHRARSSKVDTYVGHYRHVLERSGNSFVFLERRSILDLDSLRPHGKVSVIL